MKKWIIRSLGLLVSGVLLVWCAYLFHSRDDDRRISQRSFRIAPFDDRSRAFLLERQANWRPSDKDIVLSEFMEALGLRPSVRNLATLFSSAAPEYRRWKLYWWSFPRRATASNALMTSKEHFVEMASQYRPDADATMLLSDDGHLALVWISADTVIVFEDVTNAVRLSWCLRK